MISFDTHSLPKEIKLLEANIQLTTIDNTIFATGSDSLLCNDRFSAYGGCNIGGSSSVNAGLFFEPPASDWDTFHPAGWMSSDVAASIERLYERQESVEVPSQDNKLYAQSGYDVAREWLVNGAGYSEVNVNEQADNKYAVFGHTEYDYKNGQRGGPVTTYLQTALTRETFSLRSNVTVIRATRTGSKVTGVLATVNGQDVNINLTSTGRVVFSGGAVFRYIPPPQPPSRYWSRKCLQHEAAPPKTPLEN